MKKFQKYFIPILVVAIIVSGLAGFGIGRSSVKTTGYVIGGADGPTAVYVGEDVDEETVQEILDAASTADTTVDEADDASTADTDTENADVDDEEADLEDAAESTNPEDISTGSDDSGYDVDLDAYKDAGDVESATVDPAYIKNMTLKEASLPNGVASTLWGKHNAGKAAMQIVVLGDSQFGNFIDETGMAYKLSEKCQANVYNLAIGGTAASISAQDVDDDSRFDDTGLCGWVKAITGKIDAEKVFGDYTYQYNVFKSCDFSKTDVFVIEYGTNDYFMKSPILQDKDKSENRDDNLGDNIRTYNGALQYACMALRTAFPDCHIILCAPCYAEFFEAGTGNLLGNYYSLSNGVGTLMQYAEACMNVPADFNNTGCFDPINDMDTEIDYENASEYLIDGIHLTEKGREEYTQILGRLIIRDCGYSIPEDTDPAEYDWRSTK